VARATLREVLGRCVGRPAGELVFSYGSNGKPSLDEPASIHFNLAHSGPLALIAISSQGGVGIDVELAAAGVARSESADWLLSEEEIASLRALSPAAEDGAFIAWWTRKEAYVKALGGGLSIALTSFSVSFLPGSAPELRSADGERRLEGWSIFDLHATPGYGAAIVLEGEGWTEESAGAPGGEDQNAVVSNPPQALPAALKYVCTRPVDRSRTVSVYSRSVSPP
jgi:4'-phosphopantetheinyl transferase